MNKELWPRAVLTVALRGPAKALLLVSAIGWIALALILAGDRLPHISHSPGHFTAMWLAMTLAMAPPLLLREIGRLWRASLRRLRHLAIAWFACGYLGVSLLLGAALPMLYGWVTANSERIAAALVAGALWYCSPARQRCLNACHRVPALRVFGTAAQWDALRYGVSTGAYCVAACSPLMFLVLLVKDHHLVVMAVAVAVTTLERHLPARRPVWRLPVLRGRSPEWPEAAFGIRNL